MRRSRSAARAHGARRPYRGRRRRCPFGRDLHQARLPTGGARRLPVSVGKVLGRGVFVVDGKLYDAWAQPARADRRSQAGGASCRARTIGRTRRSPMPRRAGWSRDPRAICSRDLRFPGLAASHRRCRAHRQGALRQRFQGDQCRCRGARARLLPGHLLDRRRQAPRKAASKSLGSYFPRIRKAYLIGEAAEAFAQDAGRQGRRRAVAARSSAR